MISFKKFLNLKENYKGEHEAPDSYNGCPLYDLTMNGIYPSDVYFNSKQYFSDENFDYYNFSLISSCKNRPNKKVIVYRAIPKILSKQDRINDLINQKKYILKYGKVPPNCPNMNSSVYYEKISSELEELQKEPVNFTDEKISINNGDWVTINKSYAIEHGKSNLNNKYKIIRKTVYAKELFTDGNSFSEWGYISNSIKENNLEKYYYVGNCINSFDEDGDSLIDQFSDTSDFAWEEENANKISKEEFLNLVDNYSMLPKHNKFIYLITMSKHVLMVYDKKSDVHYFFAK
jgi:hypothetical protein